MLGSFKKSLYLCTPKTAYNKLFLLDTTIKK